MYRQCLEMGKENQELKKKRSFYDLKPQAGRQNKYPRTAACLFKACHPNPRI